MLEYNSPIFPKVAEKVAAAVLVKKPCFSKYRKKLPYFGILLYEHLPKRTLKISQSCHAAFNFKNPIIGSLTTSGFPFKFHYLNRFSIFEHFQLKSEYLSKF